MTEKTKRRSLDYLVPSVVALLAIAVLLTSRWQSNDRYAASDSFTGCYRDGVGSIFELGGSGILRSGGAPVGKYRIVLPVGGKHGYLVEASNLNLTLDRDRIVARSGSGGFLWPISEQGEMIVTFAPETQRAFRRRAC